MTIEELNIKIKVDLDNLQSGLKKASSSVKEWGEKAKTSINKAKDSVDSFQKKLKPAVDASKKVVAGFTVAIGACATALVASAKSTEEYRAAQAQLASAFEAAGSTADQAKETYNDLFRVLGDNDRATEASTHLAKLTQDQQGLSEWTKICEGVWATYGESLPIEGLTEAANETVKTGKVVGVLADALNWAGISEDAFNEALANCNSEAEREQLLRETLLNTYESTAELYEKNSKASLDYNDAQRRLNDTMAQIGGAMQPVLTSFEQFKAALAEKLAPIITQFIDNHLPQIQEAMQALAEKVGNVVQFIVEHIGTISTIATIIGIVAAAIVALNTVLGITSSIMGILAMNPIVIIIAAIIVAVVALTAIIVANWDTIKGWFASIGEFFVGIWEGIKEIGTNIGNFFSGLWETIKQFFVNLAMETVQKSVELVQKVVEVKDQVVAKFGELKDGIIDRFTAIKDGIKNKLNSVLDFVKGVVQKLKDFFNFNWELPHISLPHFSISGGFSLVPPSVPHISVDWYAKGGVFDTPTLFGYAGGLGGLGEAGAEAVVPLERNTEWLDRIAERLSQKSGGGNSDMLLREQNKLLQKILDRTGIYIDGKELANAVSKRQRQEQRAMGG